MKILVNLLIEKMKKFDKKKLKKFYQFVNEDNCNNSS